LIAGKSPEKLNFCWLVV